MNTNDPSIALAIHGQHTTLTELVSPADRISELEAELASAHALLRFDEKELVELRNQRVSLRRTLAQLKELAGRDPVALMTAIEGVQV